MKILTKARHSDVSYSLTGKNYEQLYAKLALLLSRRELSFFSKVLTNAHEIIWQTDLEGSHTPYHQASEEDKDEAAAIIQEFHESIRKKVQDDPEIAPIIDQLLAVPGEEHILIFKSYGEFAVTLVQWGCRKSGDAHGINPLGKIVNRPVSDRTKVEVLIRSSDGVLVIDQELTFIYKEQTKTFKTDAEGKRSFGLLKNGSIFSIADNQTGGRVDLEVIEGQTLYEVTLPYLTDLTVKVVNQLNEVMPNYEVRAEYSNGVTTVTSDENGYFELNQVQVDATPLKLISNANSKIWQEYTLNRDEKELVFEIAERIAGDLNIKVVDKQGSALAGYPIKVQVGDSVREYTSNDEGHVPIEDVELEDKVNVLVTDSRNTDNQKEYEATQTSKEFTFEANPKQVTVKLVDHKNQPVPGIKLDVTTQKDTVSKETGEEGNTTYPAELFTDGEKVAVGIHTIKKNNKKKLVKKSFKYNSQTNEYIIKLKKFNKWWLLLLLIPLLLLLLIKFEKDIVIKTVSRNNVAISNAEVNLDYSSFYFVKDWEPFKEVSGDSVANTDTDGYVQFAKLEYTVYSYIFKHFYKPRIWVLTSCYSSDTLRPVFHRLDRVDTLLIPLDPTLTDVDIKVIDIEDKQPLNRSLVNLRAELDGEVYTYTDSTRADGRVIFENVPKCANLEIAKASLYGYYPDSIVNRYFPDIEGDIKNRTLELRPVKEKLEFFVVDCRSGEPIPDAKATVTLTKPNGNVTSGTAYSNTRGKVKYFYDDAHIISEVAIEAEAPYYKKGRLENTYIVDDFIDLPDSLRTICLEPKENQIKFRTIDAVTKNGLEGAINNVTISYNGVDRDTTVTSNFNGCFIVAGVKRGEVISIKSSHDPCYEPNVYRTINKADVIRLLESPISARTIPLNPKMVTATFRTIDKIDGSLIPDADLVITVDGTRIPPNNSGNGVFQVTAPFCATIKIVADKQDFKKNDYTIDGSHTMEYYEKAPQADRDIPLEWDLACNQPAVADQNNQIMPPKPLPLGSKSGQVCLTFEMNSRTDRLIIRCGKSGSGDVLFDEYLNKKVVESHGAFSTGAYTIGDSAPLCFYFDAQKCGGYVTVEVEGPLDNPSDGSNWDFTLSCP